ncbi:mitochondrial enolase superfamily member 1 [Grus japonensis]|uniref:Mitochondrial enolase superfamily member 1 n=1 Tax=Grus japonensis TaxID=30415 RepID=A0ABC9Y3K8_GRUJA
MGRQGRGVALYLREQLECMELYLGMHEDQTESLRVRIKERTAKGGIIVYMNDKKVTKSSQNGFKEKSCLTNLKNIYDEMTSLEDKGRAVYIVYLDFSKAFDTVSHKIFID